MKLTIKQNNKVAAWMQIKHLTHNGHYEIEYLKVEPEFRGQGLATKLINQAKKKIQGTLVGLIDPHPNSSLTYDEQKQWMERHGFIEEKRYDFGDCIKKVMIYKFK